MPPLSFRSPSAADQLAIADLLAQSPEASSWNWDAASPYLWLLAVHQTTGQLAGLLVIHTLIEEEHEILNLAVAPSSRRQGVAFALLNEGLAKLRGRVFLEVRESNLAAQALYQKSGFQPISIRRNYYMTPPESAIVLERQKW